VRALGVDKGDAVAKMSRVNAGELALVLALFHDWNGIDANVRRSAIATNDVDEFGRRGRRVEANLCRRPQLSSLRLDAVALSDFAKTGIHAVR